MHVDIVPRLEQAELEDAEQQVVWQGEQTTLSCSEVVSEAIEPTH